ncbi:acyl-ACP desaturase [Nocardia pneumoniae]|uniref:acyl-ACP desaturase n=1 Tax=Nocardia pneumoniae TaxID=228601 RepID=UPI0002FAB3F0|nr:acyl-ACP desaturase [Nocardia pneumoniae]
MTTALSDRHIPRELEPAAEHTFTDHPETWNPHDYVPWDDCREFTVAGRVDQGLGRSALPDAPQSAIITNLCLEDGPASYHREISEYFALGSVCAAQVDQWSTEENRNTDAVARLTWPIAERTDFSGEGARARVESQAEWAAAAR